MSRVRPSFSQAFLNRFRSWSRLSFIRTLTRIKHSPRFGSGSLDEADYNRAFRGEATNFSPRPVELFTFQRRWTGAVYFRGEGGQGLICELYFITHGSGGRSSSRPGERGAYEEQGRQ